MWDLSWIFPALNFGLGVYNTFFNQPRLPSFPQTPVQEPPPQPNYGEMMNAWQESMRGWQESLTSALSEYQKAMMDTTRQAAQPDLRHLAAQAAGARRMLQAQGVSGAAMDFYNNPEALASLLGSTTDPELIREALRLFGSEYGYALP